MEYELIFKTNESIVFVNDFILKTAYKYFNSVITMKNGKMELFLPKEKISQLNEERYNLIIRGFDFKKFKEESIKICTEAIKFKEENLNEMSNEEFIKFLDRFLEIGGKAVKIYTETEFFHFIKIEEEIKKYIEGKMNFEEIFSKEEELINFPEDIRKLADYIIDMQEFKFELRKMMNEVWMGESSLLSSIIFQFIKRTGREDSPNMTIEEIKDCLNGKSIDVSERASYCYLSWDNEKDKLILYSGTEAYKKIKELERDIPKNEVIGNIACKGYVKGIAKVIQFSLNTEKEIHKVEKGDILVASTTGPEMMIAIQKASAIVTDEGGMMSHAAIVSREFGIPCIVGTKYATDIFKDGDLIEVNANNGVVRKISSL